MCDQLVVEGKGLQDIVSIADREVEVLIRKRFAALFPEDAVLGEEAGMSDGQVPAGAGTWVVDPIDGTWCFLNGIGSWCISIGYVRDGRTEVGVIWDPNASEMFAAARGMGATLDGRPMKVLDATSLTQGSISIGFSHRCKPMEVVPLFEPLLKAGGVFQRHGSGALGLAWTAAGRLIGYIEPHMNSWDAVAGLLLVEEAGGVVGDFLADDGLNQGNRVTALPPRLVGEVERVLGWKL
jgi:myo-inositol-1(or 4)-monophosphatase